ncbi:uncharacterized protein LOC142219549 [Haematobia irritans]|uniref:uncharacterized protein LOC142219549 n=1 Tax=Haematobia irritans TaxID=7368 RepID=UPI003F506F28
MYRTIGIYLKSAFHIKLPKTNLEAKSSYSKTGKRYISSMQNSEYILNENCFLCLQNRNLSNQYNTFPRKSLIMKSRSKFYKDMDSILPEILQDLETVIMGYGQYNTFVELVSALEYNLQNAEKNIALLTMRTYEQLVKANDITSPDFRSAHILGWCAEILNACILITDDVIDEGQLRRSLPCWYKLENIGLNALTHAFALIQSIFIILQKNFKHLECYTPLMELFHEVCFRTGCGKNMDVTCSKKRLDEFNMEDYKIMAVNKGTYYNFYLPFALAMYLAGLPDAKLLRESLEILSAIGLYFQIQNDYLDCFGNIENSGKIGTDIEDKKYSWLAITCMERANAEQKDIMMKCYGSKDPQKVQKVKDIYNSLDLPTIYRKYERESYKQIQELIKQTDNGIPHEIFFDLLETIYKR